MIVDKPAIRLTLTELDEPISGGRLKDFLKLIDTNPFGKFQQMSLQSEQLDVNYQSYDFDMVQQFALENSSCDIHLITHGEKKDQGGISLSFVKSDKRNFLSLFVHNEFIDLDTGGVLMETFAKSLIKLMPGLDHGRVVPVIDFPKYYQEIGIKKVAKCFGMFLGWLHLLTPKAYMQYYTKECLLSSPTLDVKLLNNDVIMFKNYAEPFDYNSPATKESLTQLTTYLRSHSKIKPIAVKNR